MAAIATIRRAIHVDLPRGGDLDITLHQPAETDRDRTDHHQQHRVAVAAVDFMDCGYGRLILHIRFRAGMKQASLSRNPGAIQR
jgi:hypothetical protein